MQVWSVILDNGKLYMPFFVRKEYGKVFLAAP